MTELPPEPARPAANVVVALADNKYFLAQRLATWGVGAPTLESAAFRSRTMGSCATSLGEAAYPCAAAAKSLVPSL